MSPLLRGIVFVSLAFVVSSVAIGSHLDALADRSFAWHMLQHLLLLYAVPLLVLFAAPFAIFARYAGKARTAAVVAATRPLHVLGNPSVTLVAFVGTLWTTHFSGLYDLALRIPLVHVAEHLAYVVAGTLFWLPVVAPLPLRPLPYAARLWYLLLAMPLGSLLSVALYAARRPLYTHYAHDMSAAAVLADQRNAAALMWIAGAAIALAALLATLGAWSLRDRRATSPAPASRMRRVASVVAACAAIAALAPGAVNAQGGRELYVTYCSSCHGASGRGSSVGPALLGKNAGDVHLMLDTGRMPAAVPNANEIHRQPQFTPAQIDAIVSYVTSFLGVPDTPLPALVSGDAARGRRLFAENCAACHGAAGDGASVGVDDVAPALRGVAAFQVAEAIRAGPGVMPRFGPDALTGRDVDDIAEYVATVLTPGRVDAGGIALAHVGPVAEGLVAWLFGLGALVLLVRKIGTTD